MEDRHHTPERFREAEGQLDLFEKEERQAAKAFRVACFAVLAVVVLLFALPAFAGEIRTHACKDPSVAGQLTDFIAEHGMEKYPERVKPYLDLGICAPTVLPGKVPNGVTPVYQTHNGDFVVGFYMVFRGTEPWFAILMNDIKKHPKYARAI